MKFKALHSDFQLPVRGTRMAGGMDIFMPTDGEIPMDSTAKVRLGFAAEVPENHVALIFPRSGVGSRFGLELNNTCGVIDADYRGEWMATLRTKSGHHYTWNKGARVLQFVVVPVAMIEPELAEELSETDRGQGGFGSTGK